MTSKTKYAEKWKKCLICGDSFTEIADYTDHLGNCLDYEAVFEYLEVLRRSGATNMFGAGTYIRNEFGCNKNLSHKALGAWMDNYDKFFGEERKEKS